MKKLIIFIFCLIIIGCECGHKEGEHIPNDTILCRIDKKSEDFYYNIILHMPTFEYNVKIRNLETGECRTVDRKSFYDAFNEGDTVYEIIHYCPYHDVELKKR